MNGRRGHPMDCIAFWITLEMLRPSDRSQRRNRLRSLCLESIISPISFPTAVSRAENPLMMNASCWVTTGGTPSRHIYPAQHAKRISSPVCRMHFTATRISGRFAGTALSQEAYPPRQANLYASANFNSLSSYSRLLLPGFLRSCEREEQFLLQVCQTYYELSATHVLPANYSLCCS